MYEFVKTINALTDQRSTTHIILVLVFDSHIIIFLKSKVLHFKRHYLLVTVKSYYNFF